MFIFSKPVIILYLGRDSIKIYGKKGFSKNLQFPPAFFSNLEIHDEKIFSEFIRKFFIDSRIKGKKALILLSDSIVFQKTIRFNNSQEADIKVEKFIDEIPLPPDDIAKVEIKKDKTVLVIATNKDYFTLVVKALSSLGGTVAGVVPVSVAPNLNKEHLNTTGIDQLIEEFSPGADFIQAISSQEGQEKSGKGALRKVIIAFLLIICSILVLSLAYFKFLSQGKKPDNTPVSTEPIPSPSQEATVSAKTEENFKIRILNGTGTAGQATRVKQLLEGIKLTDIETGSSTVSATTSTEVVFSVKVSDNLKEEIIALLEAVFKQVDSSVGSDEDIDIQITTGEYK